MPNKGRTAERRVCPPEFQAAIDERFGLNRFGTSRFRMVWGETELMTVAGVGGYEQRFLCNNLPCWNLLFWRAPEEFGTPRYYDLVNRDTESGRCIMGEYPYEGRYDILQTLMAKEIVNGRLMVDAFPLSYQILDLMIPLFLKGQELTDLQRAASAAYMEELENKRMVEEITDRMMDELPTRFGPVSYSKHGCKTALITRKMDEIARVWNKLSTHDLKSHRTGFYQGSQIASN